MQLLKGPVILLLPPYSSLTTPPAASNAFLIFSASSFVTPSFSTFGADSTNFLASTRFNPNMALTSRMILALAAGSKDSNLRLKTDFSASCSTGFAASAAGAAAGAADAGAATSVMFSLVLSVDIRSAVSSSVSFEIDETMSSILGETVAGVVLLYLTAHLRDQSAFFFDNQWYHSFLPVERPYGLPEATG